MPTFIFSRLYQARVKDLENLLLNHRDYKGSGREKILFLYRYYQCHLNQDTQKALESTLELNNSLNYPLSEKEVVRATKSAEKYYKGSQLNWKNIKIVDFLSINDEEIRGMSTLINHAEKTERARRRSRKHYEAKLQMQGKLAKKDAVILRQQELYNLVMQGKGRVEICSILNISRATYFNDLKVIKTDEWISQYKDKQVETVDMPTELEKTGTDASNGVLTMPKNGATRDSLKNSTPVILLYSATAVQHCTGKPPD